MATTRRPGWLDISVPLHSGMVHWPGDPEFQSHLARSLERGDVCNLTQLATSVHIGTHMDAPRHFIRDGATMEAMPLDAVVGPCRVLSIRDPESIKPAALARARLRAGERVLFRTFNSPRAWQSQEFAKDFVYISKEAAQYLVERGVRTVGVDYLSIGGFYRDGVATHQILLGAGVWVIEGLDLSRVTPGRYQLVCLPLKLAGSDGAPARAILKPMA